LSLTKKEARAKIRKAVGKPVKFDYPSKFKRRGLLKERVIVWSGWSEESKRKRVGYWDVVDLIKFPHKGGHRLWIRIGYYRQVGNKLRWASQTTITEPPHTMKRIFAQAAKQKKWFRDVLPRT
jgi:hypothetical protein